DRGAHSRPGHLHHPRPAACTPRVRSALSRTGQPRAGTASFVIEQVIRNPYGAAREYHRAPLTLPAAFPYTRLQNTENLLGRCLPTAGWRQVMVRTGKWVGALLTVVVLAWAGAASLGHDKDDAMKASIYPPDGLKWQEGPPSLPPGAKIVVLEGDPTRE